MSDIVFILGAGASADAGAPVMANFFDHAIRLQKRGALESRDQQAFDLVMKARRSLQRFNSKARIDLHNIESVFTAVEMAEILNTLPDFTNDELAVIGSALRRVIATTLDMSVLINASGKQPNGSYPLFVERLMELREGQRSFSIITFNYDMALDIALGHEWHIDYGFRPPQIPNRVPLYKLHGSLNWTAEIGSNDLFYVPVREFMFQWNSYGEIPSNRAGPIGISDHLTKIESFGVEEAKNKRFDDEPIIVPPTWGKTLYQARLEDVWKNAAAEFAGAQFIVIIGYSLPETDAFFRNLFAFGTASDTILRKVTVVNRDRTVEERFRAFLGAATDERFEFIHEEFAHTAGMFRPAFFV